MPQHPPLEVTFTLTRDDLIYWYRIALTRQSEMGPEITFLAGFVAVLIGAVGIIQGFSTPYIVIFCAMVGWGMQTVWMRSGIRMGRLIDKQAASNPSIFALCTVTLAAEWFYARSVYEDIRVRWQAIGGVTHDARYIFITVGGIAYIIARSHFSSEADAEQFLSLANTYWQTAKQWPLQDEGVWPPAPRTL